MATTPGSAPGAGTAAVIATHAAGAGLSVAGVLVRATAGAALGAAGLTAGAVTLGIGLDLTFGDPLHALDDDRLPTTLRDRLRALFGKLVGSS